MTGRAAAESCAVLMSLFLPLVSAQFDYQNAFDEDIAMYILIGIAAIYFCFTAILLIIATGYCFRKKFQSKQKPFQLGQEHAPAITKPPPLPTIHEEPNQLSNSVHNTPSSHHKRTTPHRPLARLRSDEVELLEEESSGGNSQPSSPTEKSLPVLQPIHQTPDLRKKKTNKQQETGSRASPSLPGTASPLEKTPETQRKHLPPIKHKTDLPPIYSSTRQDGTSPSPICRRDNPRLESPRMKQKKLHSSPLSLAAATSLTRSSRVGSASSASKEDLENFISELGLPPEITKTPNDNRRKKKKKPHLDTSYVMENRGFSEGTQSPVRALELHEQLTPLNTLWYQIGQQAKIGRARLQFIKNYCKTNDEKLMQFCKTWVDEEPELAWEEVVVVLRGRELENHPATSGVVREIHTKFCRISPDERTSEGTPDRSTDSQNSLTML